MKYSPTEYHVQMLPAGTTPESQSFQRSVRGTAFALANYRDVQREVVRGGGEHLHALATIVGDADDATTRLVESASVRHARELVQGRTAEDFLSRFDAVLAATPELRSRVL